MNEALKVIEYLLTQCVAKDIQLAQINEELAKLRKAMTEMQKEVKELNKTHEE